MCNLLVFLEFPTSSYLSGNDLEAGDREASAGVWSGGQALWNLEGAAQILWQLKRGKIAGGFRGFPPFLRVSY
jgi:hypothetical protein